MAQLTGSRLDSMRRGFSSPGVMIVCASSGLGHGRSLFRIDLGPKLAEGFADRNDFAMGVRAIAGINNVRVHPMVTLEVVPNWTRIWARFGGEAAGKGGDKAMLAGYTQGVRNYTASVATLKELNPTATDDDIKRGPGGQDRPADRRRAGADRDGGEADGLGQLRLGPHGPHRTRL